VEIWKCSSTPVQKKIKVYSRIANWNSVQKSEKDGPEILCGERVCGVGLQRWKGPGSLPL
jgi:hypothetical protein